VSGVRELGPGETHLAVAAMRELRPHLASVEEFVARVDGDQRAEGYRLVASFADGGAGAAAVGGFRRLGCGQIHLDSAPHRHAAHRRYLTAGYRISAFHFSRGV